MATTTPNLSLRKPAGADNVNVVTDIGDNMDKLDAIWDALSATWVPTYTALTIGNGTVINRYKQIGKMVFFYWQFTLGSTSVVGASSNITLPVNPRAGIQQSVAGDMYDVSADVHYSSEGLIVPNIFVMVGPTGRPTATVPFTWATGDVMGCSGWYEAA